MAFTKQILGLAFLLLFSGVIQDPVIAQTPTGTQKTNPSEQGTPDLLREVRLIRQAIERQSMQTARVQLIVERIRLQQDLVAQIEQRIEDTRSEIASGQLSLPQMQDRVNNLQKQFDLAQEPELQDRMGLELRDSKLVLEQQTTRTTQQRERENQLVNQLQMEKGRLDVLNDQLDRLEDELTRKAKATEAVHAEVVPSSTLMQNRKDLP